VTVKKYMVPLGLIMAQALREGRIQHDPTDGIPIIPSDPSLMPEEDDEGEERAKALTHDEVAALLTAVPEHHRLMVGLMLRTGLRISEVLGLRWQDVDREKREVRVRQAVVYGKVGPPKSKRARRSVPVKESVLRDLAARRLAAQHSGDDDLVFGTESGKPAHARNHDRWLKRAKVAAGLPWVGFHNLRHTFASRLFHAGRPVTVVSKLLGHASPSFTLNVYVHVVPTDVPDGGDIDAAIGL
jgi:integrase